MQKVCMGMHSETNKQAPHTSLPVQGMMATYMYLVTFFLLQAVFELPCEFPCDKVEGRQVNGINVPSSYTKTYEQLHFTGNIPKRRVVI